MMRNLKNLWDTHETDIVVPMPPALAMALAKAVVGGDPAAGNTASSIHCP